MNYSQARQRQHGGAWDWTTRNDGQIWRSGPCREHEDGHPTQEEAERHYWSWLLSERRVTRLTEQQRKCERCGAWTDQLVVLRDGYASHVLCPDHQDQASVERVHPYQPNLLVISS